MTMYKFGFTEKLFSFQWFRVWIYIVLGSFIMAAGFVLFITPYRIVPGGVYGIGIILHNVFPNIPVGTFGLMMDIPLLLIGLKVLLFLNDPLNFKV